MLGIDKDTAADVGTAAVLVADADDVDEEADGARDDDALAELDPLVGLDVDELEVELVVDTVGDDGTPVDCVSPPPQALSIPMTVSAAPICMRAVLMFFTASPKPQKRCARSPHSVLSMSCRGSGVQSERAGLWNPEVPVPVRPVTRRAWPRPRSC